MVDPSTKDQTKCAWDYILQLPNGLTARITPSGWIGGRFLVQYSDESSPRVAGSPGDYVYPSAIRFDSKTSQLFGLAQGFRPIGNAPVTLLFVYDLQQRKVIRAYDLKSGLIPNP